MCSELIGLRIIWLRDIYKSSYPDLELSSMLSILLWVDSLLPNRFSNDFRHAFWWFSKSMLVFSSIVCLNCSSSLLRLYKSFSVLRRVLSFSSLTKLLIACCIEDFVLTSFWKFTLSINFQVLSSFCILFRNSEFFIQYNDPVLVMHFTVVV